MKNLTVKTAVSIVAILAMISLTSNSLKSMGNEHSIGYTPTCASSEFCNNPLDWKEDTLFVTPSVCPTCEIKIIYRYATASCNNEGYLGLNIWDIVVPTTCCDAIPYDTYVSTAMNAFNNEIVKTKMTGWKNWAGQNADLATARFSAVGCQKIWHEDHFGNFSESALVLSNPIADLTIEEPGFLRFRSSKDGPALLEIGCGNVCCGFYCDFDENTQGYVWTTDSWGSCNNTGSGPDTYYCNAMCDKYQDMLTDVFEGNTDYGYSNPRKVTTQHRVQNDNIRMSPNPASDLISLRIDDIEINEYDVRIFDLNGTKVFASTYSTDRIDINTASFRSGTYLVGVYQNGVTLFLEKVIIVK